MIEFVIMILFGIGFMFVGFFIGLTSTERSYERYGYQPKHTENEGMNPPTMEDCL